MNRLVYLVPGGTAGTRTRTPTRERNATARSVHP